MALQLVKQTISTGIPVFQDIDEVAQGGFILDTTGLVISTSVTNPNVLPAGTPMAFDEVARTAKPVKTAEMNASATNSATTYQVKKGHLFAVGDILTNAVGGTAHTITAIDTSNANYDVITLDVTLGATLVAGNALIQAAAAGAGAALSGTVRGLLYQNYDIIANQNVAIVIFGRVYERRAPKASAEIKAAIPNIFYSQSL